MFSFEFFSVSFYKEHLLATASEGNMNNGSLTHVWISGSKKSKIFGKILRTH